MGLELEPMSPDPFSCSLHCPTTKGRNTGKKYSHILEASLIFSMTVVNEYFLCVKSLIVKCFLLCGPSVSVTATQLCHCRVKAAVDTMQMSGCGCVSVKLYLFIYYFKNLFI